MDNYLVLNGKRIELTEEQIKTLEGNGDKKSPFKKGKENENYYFIADNGKVDAHFEPEFPITITDDRYNAANYCTDKSLMEQRALHETLNRLLWRFSMEHGGDRIGWGCNNINEIRKNRYCISKNISNGKYSIECYHSFELKPEGSIIFKDIEIAQQAIKEIVKPFMEQHPEFVW